MEENLPAGNEKLLYYASEAFAAFENQDYKTALLFFDLFLELKPDDEEVLLYKSEALVYLEEYQKGLDIIDHLLKISPSRDFSGIRGICLLKLGRFREAIPQFNKDLRKGNFPESFLHRGWAYFGMGKLSKAITDAEASLKYDKTADAYFLLGFSYFGDDNFEKALKNLLIAEKMGKHEAEIYRLIGVSYYFLSQWKKAIKALSKFFYLNDGPHKEYLFSVLARLKSGQHKIDGYELRKLSSIIPHNPESKAMFDKVEHFKPLKNGMFELFDKDGNMIGLIGMSHDPKQFRQWKKDHKEKKPAGKRAKSRK